jgi:hypothetical protein
LSSRFCSGVNIRSDLNRAGYTDIATSLAVRNLAKKKLISIIPMIDINGNEYSTYNVTPEGESWLQHNISKLAIKRKDLGSPPLPKSEEEMPW